MHSFAPFGVPAVSCGHCNTVPFASLLSWCNMALLDARNILFFDGAVKTKIHFGVGKGLFCHWQ